MRSARAGSSGVGGARQASLSSKICWWCWADPGAAELQACKPASWLSTGTVRQTRATWGLGLAGSEMSVITHGGAKRV